MLIRSTSLRIGLAEASGISQAGRWVSLAGYFPASLRVTLWREQSLERAPAGTVERTFDSFDAVARDPGYLPAA